MKKKRNTKSMAKSSNRIADFLLFFICSCGIFVSIFLFWNDINLSFAKLHEEPIALIYFKHNTAQRRLIDRNLWERLHKTSPLYNGDRIRTAELSEAIVIFNDGNQIALHENTLIQFFKKKEKTVVAFEEGTMSVNTVSAKTDFAVAVKENVVTFAPNSSTDIVTTKSDDKTKDNTASKNSNNSQNKKSNTENFLTVKQGEAYVIDKNAVVEKYQTTNTLQTLTTKFADILRKPFGIQTEDKLNATSTIVYSNSIAKDIFTTDKESDNSVLVESVKNGQSVVLKTEATEKVEFVESTPEVKNILLPISTEDILQTARNVFTENQVKTLTVNLTAPKVASTENSTQNSTDNSETATTENQNAENADTLQADQAENLLTPNSSTLTESASDANSQSATKPTTEATQEKSKQEFSKQEFSKQEFSKQEFSTEAPKLVSPANKKTFTDADFASPRIVFKWQAVTLAKNYEFVLYNAANTNTALLQKTVTKPQFILADNDFMVLDEGSFIWKVTAKSESGQTGTPLQAEFSVSLSDIGSVELDESTILLGQ